MKPFSKPDLDNFVDLFDELPLWSAPFGLKLLDSVVYKSGITALDIGFGNGFPLTELAMRFGESSVVYGIDPWKKAIERVKRKIEFYGISNIRIIEGLAENIPLPDGSVDLITSNNGINNVTNISKVFSECSRIIKKGGQFVQTMNLDKSMIEFYNVFEQVLSEYKMKKEIEMMHHHIAEKRPALNEIITGIEKAGFITRDVVHDTFYYKFSNGTSMLNHYFIRLAFMGAWIQLLPDDKVETIFNETERKLNEQSKTGGGIILSIPFVLINAYKK
jgi:ubiquinone/menaquinone biosynthesis C-methylase UbiE